MSARALSVRLARRASFTRGILAVLAGALAAGGQNEVEGRKVVGYFPEWGVYGPDYHITNLPPATLTHVNYAFARIDSNNQVAVYDGYAATNLFYPGDCWTSGCERGSFHQIALFKQQHPGTKFLISVGGWTLSAPFYALAADAAKRQTFAQSCSNFLARYPQFDGVDLDWENPVTGGRELWGSPADAANFRLLLQAVRTALGSNKLLTAAVSANPTSIAALDYPQMAGIVDWFNVMTYEFHGPWNNYVGHNSPLFNHNDPAGSNLNLHAATRAIVARGVAPSQVVAGVAFYGRTWSGVNSSNVYSSATGAGPGTWEAGQLDYWDIAKNYTVTNGYARYWDDIAKVPWRYHAGLKYWISYDDPASVLLKGAYVRTNRLGGAVCWELAADDGALLDALRTGMATPPLRLTGLFIQGDHVAVTWEARGGTTNTVDAANGFTNGYFGASPPMIIPGTSDATTNWLDMGGATHAARSYRIRSSP